jgi:predicted peptidase
MIESILRKGLMISVIVLLPLLGSCQCFTSEIHCSGGDTLLYRLLRPASEGDRRPLILFLHGAGERGRDNEKQTVHIGKLLCDSANMARHMYYAVAPQCPENEKWVNVDWTLPCHTMPSQPSRVTSLTMDLIDSMVLHFPIDTARIYVVGLSMGGFGAWDMLGRYPHRFAGGIAVCGGGDEYQAKRLVGKKIWAFHGENDKLIRKERSIGMVKAIRAQGGLARLTIYKNTGHNSWDKAFREPELLGWLLKEQ